MMVHVCDMGRTRTISDDDVFATIRKLLVGGGEKSVSFSTVARATGLAAPTLVQRYGSLDAMLRDALMAAWDKLDTDASAAAETTKGAAAFLKALSAEGWDVTILAFIMRDPALRKRALAWRGAVEAELAARFGGGAKGREAAAILFSSWQGQLLWQKAGERTFRLKDVVKRLG
jgi:AcrR family transcriptional regulator